MLTALIEYLTVLLEYIDQKLWVGLGPAMPEFGHTTAWYTRVSAILQVLSLPLTLLIIYVYRRSWQACRQMLVYNNAYVIKSSCISKSTTKLFVLKPNCLIDWLIDFYFSSNIRQSRSSIQEQTKNIYKYKHRTHNNLYKNIHTQTTIYIKYNRNYHIYIYNTTVTTQIQSQSLKYNQASVVKK